MKHVLITIENLEMLKETENYKSFFSVKSLNTKKCAAFGLTRFSDSVESRRIKKNP